jgi:tetrapyrrole methylase family protein/MazG family protein
MDRPGNRNSSVDCITGEDGVKRGITIVGLGPGDVGLITREAWDVLINAPEIYLRTAEHPAAAQLPEGVPVTTFDSLYEEMNDFVKVYVGIVDSILEKAGREEGVIYAVPGDPTVGEATVSALRKKADESGLPLNLIHGVSFIEPCLAMLNVDALDGLFVADALELATRHHPSFPPDSPALIGQLYSKLVAAEVKLALMNQYPDDHPVVLIHRAGTSEGKIESLPLHAFDRSDQIESLTALFVTSLPRESAFESFQETVAHLRAPDGCPWDREQTHQSLRTHLMEEAYEALAALDADDIPALREELGDLLLQIVLQAQIAIEMGTFSMADVIAGIQAKIIRRHPHVFGELRVSDVGQVLHNWETLKAAERDEEGQGKGLLDGVPLGLPSLAQAAEIQARVVRVGFDWPNIEGVLEKIQEELSELQQAELLEHKNAELGDLLFSVVNYARWQGVDAESALREANLRFRSRFKRLEEEAKAQGKDLNSMTLDELDGLWKVAKEQEE